MTASPRHRDSTFGLLANGPAQTGAEGGVDEEIVGELHVSGTFNACHALPLRLLTFGVTKYSGTNPAQLSKGHVFDERKVRPSF